MVAGLNRPGGPVEAVMRRVGARVLAAAQQGCPKRTYRLARSIRGRIEYRRGVTAVVEATAPYARYVHNGTGLYGPRRRMIVAAPGKVFRFVAQDGRVVFTRRIRGSRPQPFLTDALVRVLPGARVIITRH
jgi:hypothetical protein